MNDLRISFRLHERDEELSDLLQLAAELGYITRASTRCCGRSLDGRCGYQSFEYEIILNTGHAAEILMNGLKGVLAEDTQVQAAMNLSKKEIVSLVDKINW